MHPFSELAKHSTAFTLETLASIEDKILEELESSAATPLIKALQMIRLQKAIHVVGMFSMFDAELQYALNCKNGFKKANELLEILGETELGMQFSNLQDAVNALKHGRGRSYDGLSERAASLNFRVKAKAFFDEGEVSEIMTLVDVDDEFVRSCSQVIVDVSRIVDQHPDFQC